MAMHIVEVGRYPTHFDAELVHNLLSDEGIAATVDGEVAASTLGHLGSKVAGVRILVDETDLPRAQKILKEIEALRGAVKSDDTDADDSFDDEDDSDDATITQELTRAWRAAVVGILLVPPLLHLYSLYILIRHSFFIGQSRNWRIWASLVIDVTAIIAVAYFLFR